MIRAARLDQIIGSPGLDGIDGGIDRRVSRDDNHAHPRCLDAHLRQYIQPVVLAQAQVKKADIEDLPLQQSFGLGRTVGRGYTVTFVLEAVAESAQNRRLIVH
ncbi:hypothetical protein D3C75_1093140 [compost metagenome]